MKHIPELIKKKFADLKTYTFYRQRFDACPHFTFFLGDAHGSDTNHSKYPFGQRITCARFSKNRADWYHIFTELEYTASKIIEIAKENPSIADEMISEYQHFEDDFYKKCAELEKQELESLDDTKLLALYNDLGVAYTKKLNPSPLIDGFALTTDTLISQKVQQFLEEKGMLKDFVKYFETLTAPTFLSFLQQEELAFLKLIVQIQEKPDAEDKLLQNHQKKFFWIQNNYVKDNILDIDFFRNKIVRYKQRDIAQEIKDIENLPKINENKKKELMNSLKLPSEIVTLLNITDRFNYWQDERKKGTFWATHYFSLFLQEIARRTEYTMDELKYSLPTEIEDILAKRFPKKELQARFNDCLLVWVLDGYDIITDTTMIKQIEKQSSGDVSQRKEIRGMTVSLGTAFGTVRVLESAEEIHKVQKGDILVAVMTRPDYVPAMEKAAAIVTDEGGITSHAAIVSREMKKPCIVGTKIATKVLKDGDKVEVDANHGVVKKI